jgi:hypothetical protein
MDEFELNVMDAWWVAKAKCEKDPAELARRIARRRCKTLRRPMRGWCCALRACDQRITPWRTLIVPEDGCYPGRPDLWREHVVTVDYDLVKRLTALVELPYCMDWKKAAVKLGCSKSNLVPAIKRGHLNVYHIKGIGGQRGKPIPMVWADHLIDPCSGRVCEPVNRIYGSLIGNFEQVFPKDFQQQMTRVPHLRPMYGHTVQAGWRWICPGCRRPVRMIYYPFRKFSFPDFYGWTFSSKEWDQVEEPPPMFACVKCHGVRHFSAIDNTSWNELISHMSGGLLYGFEVKKPSWFVAQRKKPYRAQINRAPSRRREEVLERLLLNWRQKKIMKDLAMKKSQLSQITQAIYARHRVHSRQELIEWYEKLKVNTAAKTGEPKRPGRFAEPRGMSLAATSGSAGRHAIERQGKRDSPAMNATDHSRSVGEIVH